MLKMPVRDDRKYKDLHLERNHVYNVYDQIAPKFSEISQKAWPNVRRFLKDLPPGSIVADIGCGSGRYLHINSKVVKFGVDICSPLVENARNKGHEMLVADNLSLPFRDGVFDAIISIGVIHHFSSQSRRLQAVKEMCRLLRPGGQIMIYVWAFEQKHRRFKTQDVLIPWHSNQSSKRSGSLDGGLSSNASSDSESSVDIEDTRNSRRNFNRTLSDPGKEQDNTHLQSYLKSVAQESHLLSKRHRCNTLPSSLEGLSGEESQDNFVPSVLAAECRKFEASLKAMSSSMFYLNENEYRSTTGNGQADLSSHQNLRHIALESFKSGDCIQPIRTHRTVENGNSEKAAEISHRNHSEHFKIDNTNSHERDKHKSTSKVITDIQEPCGIIKSAVVQENVDSSRKSNSNCDICPGHKPSLTQYLCSNDPEKDPDVTSQTTLKDGAKARKNKFTLFSSIKESFLNFFEGKSSKMKKPKLETALCDSGEMDVSDFAVREFPMSSCPNYRKEIISEELKAFQSSEIQGATLSCVTDELNVDSEMRNNPACHTCLEAIASDSQETSCHISCQNDTLLKHSMSDLSPSKCQSLKRFDEMSSDSLKLRSHMSGLSQRHSYSLPAVNHITEAVQDKYSTSSVPSSPAVRNETLNKSTELSRFYHVFKDGELPKLISKHVPNVKIVSSIYDHANWCIVAEKCN
ncbi:uncharacterized protein LOC133173976 isoform X2 [Saccostrea echinata]|uniref:uncharacterized protein LOC133173976 isoform X2 n=1 Tax=Saccostrea echinata TaxID=191078 RepID=UPI002A7F2A16|nr:uncharacterized protein LOC133173976 isoform X2 [Saccostrea echinata]